MNLRQDLKLLVGLENWSPSRLSKESGVRVNIITRFIKGERKEMRSGTLEKLWPFLYGPQRPEGATWESPTDLVSGEQVE